MKRIVSLKFSLILTLCVVFLGSCNECIDLRGDVTTETRDVDTFDAIEMRGSMDIILTQDSEQSLEIEAPLEIIERMTTDVSDGTLIIDFENGFCFSTSATIKVYAQLADLTALSIKGSGDVTTTNALDLDRLNIDIKGSGDVELEGTVNEEVINIQGSGDVNNFDLVAQDIWVDIEGSGDVEVAAENTLDVVIKGSGNVSYKGTPTITSDIKGSGDLKNAN